MSWPVRTVAFNVGLRLTNTAHRRQVQLGRKGWPDKHRREDDELQDAGFHSFSKIRLDKLESNSGGGCD
ncbi:uncharacterized protein PGTG_21945 [Puccinia graminis f. sp. tritici CRL 75-36-700-3]|uniref:Uncharacterized protein n=1 Tax=Puccinia graminis f. sp. tritici (strain CRL 75-36-700-3 / race SCCL) TaxID=418459 RepID=H6QSX3_PUCGT|nr:uncharacterized protein PGTG_21945 [Puccinia graminis f. sp. tritici CRL 75-36-700-3]EHS63927.1 hypothetical protein PGTG_21945 [Puccinia graminis f. sp. tritici CRL 75-36-700-3]